MPAVPPTNKTSPPSRNGWPNSASRRSGSTSITGLLAPTVLAPASTRRSPLYAKATPASSRNSIGLLAPCPTPKRSATISPPSASSSPSAGRSTPPPTPWACCAATSSPPSPNRGRPPDADPRRHGRGSRQRQAPRQATQALTQTAARTRPHGRHRRVHHRRPRRTLHRVPHDGLPDASTARQFGALRRPRLTPPARLHLVT